MEVSPNISVSKLVKEMGLCGVLGAGRVAKASEILKEMFFNPDYTVYISLAGPVVAGGLRNIVSRLIAEKLVDVVVSNGGNLTHDLIEALGFKHLRGENHPNDVNLNKKKIGRIGDVYVKQNAFQTLEKEVYRMLDRLIKEHGETKIFPVYRVLEAFGFMVKDENSILALASKMGVPVFSPGIYDSMLGYHLWTYGRLKGLKFDFSLDMEKMAETVFKSKKIGAIILGGGLPKHFVLGASMLKGGVDAAIQITMDRPETGSLSGAPLEEAISWGKAKAKSRLVNVIGDYTVLFPLIVASVFS
ncbi:MAG: deoxyhypusine synthase [Candidatus Hecatellales archaeon]|nr:MAG: deoxyhypusine synthase [Candidatus Hecatellales archaeon]